MRRFSFLLIVFGVFGALLPVRGEAPDSVSYEGRMYVSLGALVSPGFLNGTYGSPHRSRDMVVKFEGRSLAFEDGGERVRVGLDQMVNLQHPVVVYEGECFVGAEECAPLFGYKVIAQPGMALVYGERKLTLKPRKIDSEFRTHRVSDLKVIRREAWVTNPPLEVRGSLLPGAKAEGLPGRTLLAATRSLVVDGVTQFLVVDCDSLETYLVAQKDFESRTQGRKPGKTSFDNAKANLPTFATSECLGLIHGPRERLPQTVSLTLDMCWSLRDIETEFFFSLPEIARARGGKVWPVVFVTGRWMEQHPGDMDRLIRLSQRPEVVIIWGNHSWVHPKDYDFMNDFSPEELEADTLRTESLMLEYGIVPTVYYRFPGLIHDEAHLGKILELDLLPIDCESWMSAIGSNQPPSRVPPRDGSILLLHGNGNEHSGITVMNDWLTSNPTWKFGPLNEFVAPEE
ncbi:MAG: polysaccharide deacetylase family protein [bacterium]